MRFFFNPVTGQLNAGPPPEIVYADAAPQYPLEGSRWFDTINLREYVYTGTEWVESGVGPAGAKGDKGEKGDSGDVGNVGPAGPKGEAATVTVGTVTTGAAGTSASVSNSGTSGAAVLDFTIPQGVKGDTGDLGPQGPQGPKGEKGDDGASVTLKGAVATPADLNAVAVKLEGDLYIAQSDGNGYVWDGSAWVNVGQIRGPKGDTGAQGPAGPAPAGTGAVVVSNGVVGTPVGYGTDNIANTLVQRDASGNFTAGTITGTFSGNVTGGVTGNVTGNASTASKLATAQTINVSGDVTGTAQSFDGSAAITIPTAISAGVIVNADINDNAQIADTKLATISTANKVSNSATTATSANAANAIVARDSNGNFSANTITAALSGNATTASSAAKLTTARNINGVPFDGSADITIAAVVSGVIPVSQGGTGATTAAAARTNLGAQVAGSYAAASHTHATATAAVAGFMSAADKAKLDGVSSSAGVPAGAIMPFAMNAVPSGWLIANGALLLRTSYPALFAAIGVTYGGSKTTNTDFQLPDLRGYFVRGAGTNSDGTVSGTFGEKQSDAFQGHYHSTRAELRSFVGPGVGWDNWLRAPGTGSAGNNVANPVSDGINGTPRTSPETRPKNIAMLYCIKF